MGNVISVFSQSDFENYDEFSEVMRGIVAEDTKIISYGLDGMPARFCEEFGMRIELLPCKSGVAGAALQRARKMVEESEVSIFFVDMESYIHMSSISLALAKNKKVLIHFFGYPQKENLKDVTSTADGGCWLHDRFPCKVSYKEVDYDSVEQAMAAIKIMASKEMTSDGDYRNEEWLKSLGKDRRDKLLKVMFDLQSQKFSVKNPELRRKMELQKGKIALKENGFWPHWINRILEKIKNENLIKNV